MNKIIPYNPEYRFVLVEDAEAAKGHPCEDYFLKPSDLSINLLISLKWILWGYKFFHCLSEELSNSNEDYKWENLFEDSIQNIETLSLKEKEHQITVDGCTIKSQEELSRLIKNLYELEIFDENTKVHIKMKMNLREYFIISNYDYPAFIKFKSVS